MNLLHQVESISYDYRSGSRRAIGEFIIKESTHLHEYSVQEIAEKTFTSKAALVRFAKALGFQGWKEFSRAFVEEQNYQAAHYTDIDPNYPFAESDSTRDIISKMCSLQVESLLDTADLLDDKTLDQAADLLEQAEQIAIFGLNPNLQLAQLFVRKMLSIGKKIYIASSSDVGMMAGTLTEKDCAIVISYSGNTIDRVPMNLLDWVEKNHVPVLAITSAGESQLSRIADCVLNISSRERLFNKIATFATENSILYLLNVLFACYFVRDYHKNLKYKIEHSRQLEYVTRHAGTSVLEQRKDIEESS